MKQLQELMHDDMQGVDRIIRLDLSSKVALINQISEYIIVSGGKRIRPLLTLLCGRISGFKEGDLLYKMAAMIEYIHTATLLHDDVVDQSGMRRGRKTSNAIFGNAASVLVGDFIYTRAFQTMIESNSLELLAIMADCTNKISEGEVLQLLNIGKSDLTEIEYFSVIESKTAVLFEAAARVGVTISGGDKKVADALANYAINLGIAFQVADDLLDYTGDTNIMGKSVGDDLQEGKVTLPVLYLLNNGTKEQRLLIKHAIENPETANVEAIINLIKQNEVLSYCIDKANNFVDLAVSSLEIFPSSKYKHAMLELAHHAVSRVN